MSNTDEAIQISEESADVLRVLQGLDTAGSKVLRQAVEESLLMTRDHCRGENLNRQLLPATRILTHMRLRADEVKAQLVMQAKDRERANTRKARDAKTRKAKVDRDTPGARAMAKLEGMLLQGKSIMDRNVVGKVAANARCDPTTVRNARRALLANAEVKRER